ncbi:hypothetical protein FOZ63_026030, partial [Perkinsus olseni]
MLQTTSILFVFLPTLSVEAQPAEIRSNDGCLWVEGLGCELSYEAECHAYQSIDRPSLWPMLNELDWQYYENRCSYCLAMTDRDTCVASEICEWSAGMCSYSKHTLASRAIQEPHSGGEDRVSFLRSEVAAHMMCQRVREAEDCQNVWGCLWDTERGKCLRDIWAVMSSCCPWLQAIYTKADVCRNRSSSYIAYLYLPTTSSDWSVFEEILKPVCSQRSTTPDQLRDALERIAEVYTRRDRAARWRGGGRLSVFEKRLYHRFYKDLPRMLWKLPVKERAAFLGTAVPEMARRVIEIEAVMGTKTVGLLRKRRGGGEDHSVSFTPYQASALLSLAFFGVPMYWSDDGCSGRGRPSVRFNFAKFYHDRHNQVAKLRCIVLYFNRQCGATGTSDDRRITITRVRGTHGRMGEWWSTRDVPMSQLEVHGDGERIEDAVGLLQADFANCRVGGG